jgi:hypothetical protein
VTPNDLNRRVVAEWLQDWDISCTGRRMCRYTHPSSRRVVIELVWDCDDCRLDAEFIGRSRAEATAKAAEWIRGKGWEVTSG